ncbi:MAG: efflux RND transporter periplasmic adaptor subunit [Ginsengibacter sp.]
MIQMIWNLIGCVVIFYGIQGCGSSEKEKLTTSARAGNNSPLQVEGYVVKTSTLNENIEVPGTLLPFEETEIHPEVAGKIVMLSITEGSFVSRGALLARVFDGDLTAQVQKLNVQLQVAQKTQERQSELLKIGGISQQDYDLSALNVISIRSDIHVLQADITKTYIRAPFSGKIGFKNISIGAYVTPATIVTTIRQINKLKLEFSIPEKYNSKVVNGKYVSFTVEGAPKKYSAKVIATESTITPENRSLKARAQVDEVDKYVTAGAFAKVNFDMGENNQALMVPSQAIIPGARDKKVITDRNGLATFQTVTTGTRDSVNVQIVSGIAVGDTVITTGILQIKPGSKIKISSIKK